MVLTIKFEERGGGLPEDQSFHFRSPSRCGGPKRALNLLQLDFSGCQENIRGTSTFAKPVNGDSVTHLSFHPFFISAFPVLGCRILSDRVPGHKTIRVTIFHMY